MVFPRQNTPEVESVIKCKRLWRCSVGHLPDLCADGVTKLGFNLNPSDDMYFWFEAPSDVLDIVMSEVGAL